MICRTCNTEILEEELFPGKYTPTNNLLRAHTYGVPFCCSFCGAIKFPYKAVRDVVFVYPFPYPAVYKEGTMILIPEKYKEFYGDGTGVILSIGPGYYDNERFRPTPPELVVGLKVLFDKDVPWRCLVPDGRGKSHEIVYCGVKDVRGIIT